MLYDYKCSKCDHVEVDKLVKRTDEVVPCPECDTPMDRQVCATAGWLLRGEGFHRMHGKELIRAMEKKYGLEETV